MATYRLTESALRKMIREAVEDSFEDRYNRARDNYKRPFWGFEMKKDGDWKYGEVLFDPNTNTMSCMGVSIDVDPDMSVDANLEALYDELINNGYTNGDNDE